MDATSTAPDFFQPGRATDPEYLVLRDDPREFIQDARRFVEHMWSHCGCFLDRDLPERARTSFASVHWELYLAFALYYNGVHLVRRGDRRPARSGPDILVSDPRLWIEATAPGPGTGADRVPGDTTPGLVVAVPDDQIILRLRNAIDEKLGRFRAYEARGWVAPAEPVLIAISGAALPWRWAERDIPRIVRTVLPIGDDVLHISINDRKVVGRTHEYRPHVVKASGSQVTTNLFLDEAYSRISGVMFCYSDALNRPAQPGPDLTLVLNPKASAPLVPGWLHFGWEYWVEADTVHRRAPNGA
jgi:hypothetical protein